MLLPRRVKYRKQHRGRMAGAAKAGTELAFGRWGLQALENAWVTQRQIEAGRIAVMRSLKSGGKLWIRIFPDKPVTKKPSETRMGKGKGDVDHWVATVRRGRVLFELDGLPAEDAREALRLAASKFPIATRLLERA